VTDLFDATPWQPVPASPAIGMTVRLDRAIDRDQPCHDNLAIIHAGKPPHAGELRCANCGAHRGWAPKIMFDFITETAARFGAPAEPPVLRDSTIGGNIMATKQYDNIGILFRSHKQKENDRDYRGEITINGVEYWLSGWIKEGKKGKFLGLAVKPKDPPSADKSKPLADEMSDAIPL
jgi:hypothetical protein